MKKTIMSILSFLLIPILLPSCALQIKEDKQEKNGLYIVCTAFPQYDFLKNIAGGAATIELLLPPGAETHNFGVKDLSPSKLAELADADLFIYIGGENDSALVSELRTALPNSKTQYISLISLVSSLLDQSDIAEDDHDNDHDHDKNTFDEHVWTSPKRAKEIVSALTEILSSEDKQNKDLYEHNAATYIEQLEMLDAAMTALCSSAEKKTLIFADRFPFRYLCHDYGLTALAAFSGCSTEIEPSLSALDRLYNAALAQNIKIILYVDGSDSLYAENMADRLGGNAKLLHSCHNLTKVEFETASYISLMQQNIEVLKSALTQE